MKNCFFPGSLVFLMMMMASCSTDDLVNEGMEGVDASAKKSSTTPDADEQALGGPIFDLETAPNGEMLVADASRGITDLWGNLVAPLPGVTSVSSVGMGVMWATMGPEGEGTSDFDQGLYRVQKNRVQLVANLFNFENTYNPAGGTDINSNPYAVLALNGNSALVIDSGANVLLRVNQKGTVEVIAIFPEDLVSLANYQELTGCGDSTEGLCGLEKIPAQAVPTSVVLGPDGHYYVGELKGFPAPTGASNIWRISPDAMAAQCGESPDCVKLFNGGFTSIIDMAFGDDGMLYVAEMDARSWFAVEIGQAEGGRIQKCDPQTLECQVIAENIFMLTSIVFDKEGRLWATQNALDPASAQVVQIAL